MAELRVAGSSITHTSSMTGPAPMLVCHEPLSSLKSPVNKLKRRSDLIDSLSALSPRSLSCTSRGPQHSYSLAKIRKQQVLFHGFPLRSCSADSAPRASFADTRCGLGSTSPDDVPAAPSDTMIQLGDRGTESRTWPAKRADGRRGKSPVPCTETRFHCPAHLSNRVRVSVPRNWFRRLAPRSDVLPPKKRKLGRRLPCPLSLSRSDLVRLVAGVRRATLPARPAENQPRNGGI